MNFRDRVQDIIAASAALGVEPFGGFEGLGSRRVLQNALDSGAMQTHESDIGDTFLESFKRKSEYQFFREKKSPTGAGDPGHENGKTRPGTEPLEPI